jgi:hypothetical protein
VATIAIAAHRSASEHLLVTFFLIASCSLNFTTSFPVSHGSLVHLY